MRIDWIIAVVTFVMFVTWSFTYYSLINAGDVVTRSDAALQAGDRIVEYMKIPFSSIPVNITSSSDTGSVTLWAYLNWTGNETESTRVVKQQLSAASLDCMISGDKLIWEADLTTGDNYFFVEYADFETALNCDKSLSTPDGNQTSVRAAEEGEMFSSERNLQLCDEINQSYETKKGDIGITFDFNVLIETAGSVSTCGSTVPSGGTEVFAFPYSGRLWEGGDVNMTVRLW